MGSPSDGEEGVECDVEGRRWGLRLGRGEGSKGKDVCVSGGVG